MGGGVWDVRCLRLSSLQRHFRSGLPAAAAADDAAAAAAAAAAFPPPAPLPPPSLEQESPNEGELGGFWPVRLISCRGAMDTSIVDALAAAVSEARGDDDGDDGGGTRCESCTVPKSGWAALLRNVPATTATSDDDDDEDDPLAPESHVVAVAKRTRRGRATTRSGGGGDYDDDHVVGGGDEDDDDDDDDDDDGSAGELLAPILVLVGLKYRGNVGSIVRAAVQADCFSEIHIVEERQAATGDTEGDGRRGGGSGGRSNHKHRQTTTKTGAPTTRARGDDANSNNKRAGADNGGGGGAAAAAALARGGADRMLEQPFLKLAQQPKWTDADVAYYSLWNAPLLPTRRFATVKDFFDNCEADELRRGRSRRRTRGLVGEADGRHSEETPLAGRRRIVGIDGGTSVVGAPLSLYSAEAMEVLRWRRSSKSSRRRGGEEEEEGGGQLYIAMGAEDQGLPAAFLDRCQHLVMIPCLSASVNVASAFSSVLAVMCLGDAVGPL